MERDTGEGERPVAGGQSSRLNKPFYNVMLDWAKKAAGVATAACLLLGLAVGWFIGRRRKNAA